MTPEMKTIADIARENRKPPKPPSIGSIISGKWSNELHKFVGQYVTVRCLDRESSGVCVAIDLAHGHVILRVEAETVLIRNPHEVRRGAVRSAGETGNNEPIAKSE